MSQTEKGQPGSDRQTGDIKTDLDLRVADAGDICQFPWKQVGGDDGQTAPVGQRNADAEQYIADGKIQDAPGQRRGQYPDPQLVDIQQLAECKAHHKAEQIRRHKSFAHYHQTQHQ